MNIGQLQFSPPLLQRFARKASIKEKAPSFVFEFSAEEITIKIVLSPCHFQPVDTCVCAIGSPFSVRTNHANSCEMSQHPSSQVHVFYVI
jgi:hypothetical protein